MLERSLTIDGEAFLLEYLIFSTHLYETVIG